MKCDCRSETEGHDHKAGECQRDATHDRLCKPCHDLAKKEIEGATGGISSFKD